MHYTIAIVLSLILIIFNDTQLNTIRYYIANIISPIYYIVDTPNQIYNWVNENSDQRSELINKIQILTTENKILKSKLQTYNSTVLELQKVKNILNTSYILTNTDVILASVNNISQSRLKSQIVINKGEQNNVRISQVAVGDKGIIGQVIFTTSNHATILGITDPTHYIAVKNQRNGLKAIAQGLTSYDNTLKLNFVQKDSDIKIGDIFVSSGVDNKFPKNHPVAIVRQINNTYSSFMDIKLSPIENINLLDIVLLINNDK